MNEDTAGTMVDERMFRSLQPVPPFFQRHLHHEKLPIPHIVVSFRGIEAMGK
jgi:hypothetical protein